MASKRRLRREAERKARKGCEGKARHPTEAGARVAVRETLRHGARKAGFLTTYQCKHCGFWHIGHMRFRDSLTKFIDKHVSRGSDDD